MLSEINNTIHSSVVHSFDSLTPQLVERLVHLGKTQPFVLEKVITKFPFASDFVNGLAEQHDFFSLIVNGWNGLLYPKWQHYIGKEQSAHLQNLISGFWWMNTDAVRVFESRFKKTLGPFSYQCFIEKVLINAIRIGNVDIIKYLVQDQGYQLTSKQKYEAFVECEFDAVREMLIRLQVFPSKDVLLEMMIKTPHWPTCIPPDISKSTCYFSRLLLRHLGFELGREEISIPEERITLDEEQTEIARYGVDFWEVSHWFDSLPSYRGAGEFKSWNIVQYLHSQFGNVPDDMGIDTIFFGVIADGDVQGAKFILEKLCWEPSDIDYYMECAFSFDQLDIARYMIRHFELYDWEETY